MTYRVLARKWRPQTFADLVGQSHVVKALTFALSNNQVHHAYLFTGTRGVGKTSIARIFAKSLNCETAGVSANPCGECESCREIKSGKFVDLIEVDAASRTGVDETRELIESVSYLPTKGRYKVYLIDEVHMFSKSSFNALLKTLEEPPAHVKFILATTDPEKLPVTILSRCLQFNLKSLTQAQIQQHLVNICQAESIAYDAEALTLLANAGDGSMRDTLSMTDQAIAYGQGHLNLAAVTEILGTIQPTDIEAILFAIATNNPVQLNEALLRLDQYEIDARAFLIEIMKRLQRMAWAKEGIVDALSPSLLSTVSDLPKSLIHLWYDIAEKALPNLVLSGDPRKSVEMTLLRMIAFIPDDWVARRRTTFEAAIEVADTTIPSEEKNQIAANSLPQEEAPVSPQSTEVPPWEELPKHSDEVSPQSVVDSDIQEKSEKESESFAQQAHAIPIAEQESLEAAEASFSQNTTETTEETTTELAAKVAAEQASDEVDKSLSSAMDNVEPTAVLPTVEPVGQNVTANAEQGNGSNNQAAWHLSSEQSEEVPPSMAEIRHMMQRGSDIAVPVRDNASLENDEVHLTANSDLALAAKQAEQAMPAQNDGDVLSRESDNLIEAFDWFEAVKELSLTDYTLHFVSLGLLRLEQGGKGLVAILDLSPKHAVLKTQESVAEMQTALQTYFDTPVQFSVNLTDVYELTPAERKQRQQQQSRDSIVQQFNDSEITQRIVKELGGQVVDKTIRATKF